MISHDLSICCVVLQKNLTSLHGVCTEYNVSLIADCNVFDVSVNDKYASSEPHFKLCSLYPIEL